jgi:hypothetical protein
VNGDVIHMAFHPSGRQFAAVCPRSRRDEVLFFHLVESGGKEVWAKREDVDIGGLPVGAEAPFDEVGLGTRVLILMERSTLLDSRIVGRWSVRSRTTAR